MPAWGTISTTPQMWVPLVLAEGSLLRSDHDIIQNIDPPGLPGRFQRSMRSSGGIVSRAGGRRAASGVAGVAYALHGVADLHGLRRRWWLFGRHRELVIGHNGCRYVLRITRHGKLILNKLGVPGLRPSRSPLVADGARRPRTPQGSGARETSLARPRDDQISKRVLVQNLDERFNRFA